MSVQFTRAPWMAAAGPSSVVGWPIVSCGEGGGRSIATVSWMPGLPDELVAEIRANANLIAAAPELYEALKTFVAEADAGNVSVKTDNAARAAIAKARGEQ